ncbi:MAG: UDP-2,3-diacylglucosamine diphosphatase [Rikenellaceae bacterium]
MQHKIHHKTIVLSDIHLGSRWSKPSEVLKFLKAHSCDTLILCGDIIDGWSIMRGKQIKWRRIHTNVMKYLLSIQENCKIVYIRGNHDNFLDRLLPLSFGNMSLVKEYIYKSFDRTYYVVHGDEFDNVTTSWRRLAKIGDIGYSLLLWINSVYNKKRAGKNLPYKSISGIAKRKVKGFVSYISQYEKHLTDVAVSKGCNGVICGHIHHPEIRYIGDLLYLNSGDWVESLSAVTEEFDGSWNILYYGEEISQNITENPSIEDTLGMRIPATM